MELKRPGYSVSLPIRLELSASRVLDCLGPSLIQQMAKSHEPVRLGPRQEAVAGLGVSQGTLGAPVLQILQAALPVSLVGFLSGAEQA